VQAVQDKSPPMRLKSSRQFHQNPNTGAGDQIDLGKSDHEEPRAAVEQVQSLLLERLRFQDVEISTQLDDRDTLRAVRVRWHWLLVNPARVSERNLDAKTMASGTRNGRFRSVYGHRSPGRVP